MDSAGQRSKVKKTKSTLGSGGNGNADQNKFHSMTSLTMSSTNNDNDLKEENPLNTTNESDVEHGGNFCFFRPPKKNREIFIVYVLELISRIKKLFFFKYIFR